MKGGRLRPARAAAGAAVKRLAGLADVLRPTGGLVVLAYHRVGGTTPSSVDVDAPVFAAQMDVLAATHEVVDLDRAAELLDHPTAPDGRPVAVLTFDDGTADFVEHALPILVERQLPSTLYVATGHVEDRRPFFAEGRPISWAGLAEAHSTGLVTVGSHTNDHLLLDRTAVVPAVADVDRSIQLVAEHVGEPPSHFAYPKALVASGALEEEIRARFRTAAVAGTRPNPYGSTDLHRLRRSPIQAADGMRFFERKLRGGMWLEDDLRVLANNWRYRGARV